MELPVRIYPPMYSTCAFCYSSLGENRLLESLPVGRRIAFDPARGSVWVVCGACGRWNLAPLEERWEVADECERRFRATALRYSSANVGLAWLADDLELVRIGRALRPEVAAWRYGRVLKHPRSLLRRAAEQVNARVLDAWRVVARRRSAAGRPDVRAALARLVCNVSGGRVLDVVPTGPADADAASHVAHGVAVIRYAHMLDAFLTRPEEGHPWALSIPHDHGVLTMEGDQGLRAAARAFAIVNGTERGGGFDSDLLESAARKVDESAQPGAYFNRVLALALRSAWGRIDPNARPFAPVEALERASSDVERLAFRLTGRTFWGRGGIGSDPSTALLDIPLVDRVALEMAANEESERRALEGELEDLEEAWREAAEIAAIADALLD